MRIEVKPASERRSSLLRHLDVEEVGRALALVVLTVLVTIITAQIFKLAVVTAIALAVSAVAVVFALLMLAARWLIAKPQHHPRAVEVGGEGVLLEYASGPLMLPMERIVHLLAQGDQLTIKARGIESVVVTAGTATEAKVLRDDFERLRHEQSSHKAAKALSIAKRATDEHTDRVAHLASAAGSKNNYRNTALSPDDLAALLASAKTPPHHRIAAAEALLRVEPELAQQSLRTTRGQTLNQPLRIALTHLEQGELEAAAIEEADDWFRQHATQPKE